MGPLYTNVPPNRKERVQKAYIGDQCNRGAADIGLNILLVKIHVTCVYMRTCVDKNM